MQGVEEGPCFLPRLETWTIGEGKRQSPGGWPSGECGQVDMWAEGLLGVLPC
jgi:hypothetical protein